MLIQWWQLLILLFSGFALGAILGFFACACLTVASDADDRMERMAEHMGDRDG